MLTIKAIGFTREDAEALPKDMRLVHVTISDMVNGEVYLLHSNAIPEVNSTVDPWKFKITAFEKPMIIVLYQVPKIETFWVWPRFIDYRVNEGDWETLRDLFSCPLYPTIST